jgi:hypothetical protein
MPLLGIAPIPVVPVYLPHVLPLFQQPPPYQGPAFGALQGPNLIGMDDDKSIANVFCFGAFADKNNGVVYNDLTGSFPFISPDGSICFFIMYHYIANANFAKPISGLDASAFSMRTKCNSMTSPEKGSTQKSTSFEEKQDWWQTIPRLFMGAW